MTASIRFVLQQQSFPTSKSPLNRIPKSPKCSCGADHATKPGA